MCCIALSCCCCCRCCCCCFCCCCKAQWPRHADLFLATAARQQTELTNFLFQNNHSSSMGGLHSTMDSVRASPLVSPGSILGCSRIFSGEKKLCCCYLSTVHCSESRHCKAQSNYWQASTTKKDGLFFHLPTLTHSALSLSVIDTKHWPPIKHGLRQVDWQFNVKFGDKNKLVCLVIIVPRGS